MLSLIITKSEDQSKIIDKTKGYTLVFQQFHRHSCQLCWKTVTCGKNYNNINNITCSSMAYHQFYKHLYFKLNKTMGIREKTNVTKNSVKDKQKK